MQSKTLIEEYPKLVICDFDLTLNRKHTGKGGELPEPKLNTKVNLSEHLPHVVHNDHLFFAIATFHKDPAYVLSYVLPLLGLNQGNIIKENLKAFAHHQLWLIYLENLKHPLIIASPQTQPLELGSEGVKLRLQALHEARVDREFYNNNLRLIARQGDGKNHMLTSIMEHLPPCTHYYYYEDEEKTHERASALGLFHTFLVSVDKEGANDQLVLVDTGSDKPHPLNHLKHFLQAFLKSKADYRSLRNLSILAASGESHTLSQRDAAEALCELIDCADVKQFDMDLLNSIKKGALGQFIETWEQETGKQLESTIVELVEGRNTALTYTHSDEENFDDWRNRPY